MELKVGMYVRTNEGIGTIHKIVTFQDGRQAIYLVKFNKGHIKKCITVLKEPSYKLGELLEPGDFIDKHYITEIKGTTIYTYSGWFIDFDDIEDCVDKVLTHEQFENMAYKVGG